MTELKRLMKTARSERNVTMQQAADMLHISLEALRKYESGERRLPTDLIGPIHEILGISKMKLLKAIGIDIFEDSIPGDDRRYLLYELPDAGKSGRIYGSKADYDLVCAIYAYLEIDRSGYDDTAIGAYLILRDKRIKDDFDKILRGIPTKTNRKKKGI